MGLKSFVKSYLGVISDTFNNTWVSMSLFGGAGAQRNIKAYVERGFGKNPYVYMVVKKIADLVSRLDYVVIDANGKEVKDLNFALFYQPNSKQTTQEFIDNITQELEITGNAFIRIVRAGRAVALNVLKSKNICIKTDTNGNILFYEYSEYSKTIRLNPDDVWQIKFNNPTGCDEAGLYGLSPLQSLMQVVESSNDLFETESVVYKNRGVNTILTNDSERPMLPKDKEDLQSQFDSEIAGASNYGKVRLSTAKLRAIDIGMTPAQLQLSQNSVHKLRIICGAYGVSSYIFGDSEKSTYNNMKEAYKSLYVDVILPTAEMIVSELNDLFKQEFKTKNNIVILKDKIEALKEVNSELTSTLSEQLSSNIININEARVKLGLPEIELPKNTATLNGAQVTSLIEVLRGLGEGVIPVESARAVINAAFPTIPQDYINQIVDAYKLKPKQNG